MALEGTTSPDGRVAPPAVSRWWRRNTIVATLTFVAVLGVVVWTRAASDDPPDSGPEAIWGRRWQLVRLDVGDAVIDTGLVGSGGGAIVLDARESGEMSMRVCNETGGPASVVNGRIELGLWFTTAMGCGDPLDGLVRFDGASINATAKRLVLSTTGEDGGPAVRTTWVPSDSLSPDDAIRGRAWSVTEVRGPSGERRTMEQRIGPVVSLLEPGRLVVTGCGTHSKPGRVVEGRIEVKPGPWTEQVAECESSMARKYTPMIMKMAESTGGRTGPVTIRLPRSQEQCHGRDPLSRTEAVGVPTPRPRVAACGHRTRDRLHRADGRAHGSRRPVHHRRARHVGTAPGLFEHR